MSKFIIVSGSYDPYPKANAVCAMSIEQALKENGHQVIYVVTRHNVTQQTIETINGNKVYFIPETINETHLSFTRMKDSFLVSAPEKIILKITHLFIKLTFKIVSCLKGKSSRERAIHIYKNNFIKVMTNLLLQEKPDTVLTFSVPFSSHLYTHESFLKTGYRPIWISFLIDAHSQKSNVNEVKKNIFKKEELLVFENTDKCFFLNTLKEGYSKNNYPMFVDKFRYFRLPFLQIPLNVNVDKNLGISKSKDYIDLTFAGTLYDDFRPTDYFCSFIKAAKNKKIRFHIMGKLYPKNLRKFQELAAIMPAQVFLYGFKSRDFVLASLNKSSALINIGNNNTNQIPSKILEYIGLQKPIFSFIRDENDAALEYLDRYTYSFVIDENKETPILGVLENAMQFCENCKMEKLSVPDLRKSFEGYLQEDVTDEIVKIIENQLNDRK